MPSATWYPGKRNSSPTPKGKTGKPPQAKTCLVCDGKGTVPDRKTGIMRDCVLCNGTGLRSREYDPSFISPQVIAKKEQEENLFDDLENLE